MARKSTGNNEFTDVAHNVWLAGLGALAAAGDEGERLFRTLVARGKKVEKQVVQPMDKAGTRLRSTVKEVRTRASKSLGSIQTTIDDSVTATLHSLGVPTRKEIAALGRKVEQLTRAVNGKGPKKAKPARKKAKKATAKKTTAKRRTARKATH